MDGGKFIGLIFGGIGVVLAGLAAHLCSTDAQLAGGETATDTVVEMRDDRTRAASTRNQPRANVDYRRPVIDFSTRTGTRIRFVALAGSYPEGIKVGDKVDVRCLPENPSVAEISASSRLSDGVLLLTIFGSACMVPGLVLVVLPLVQGRRRAAILARVRERGKAGSTGS